MGSGSRRSSLEHGGFILFRCRTRQLHGIHGAAARDALFPDKDDAPPRGHPLLRVDVIDTSCQVADNAAQKN
jgi:hypothetical protein